MAKKIIMILLVFILSLSRSYASVYASNIDELENRGETENLAGVTWDQINEMSNNAPNSLTPIQGLVLWMFTILAFLKLAQKMDSLLQSLGLNVTQTGGRAVGDLIMAGMALKNIGGMMSKGMGMFGFGKSGSTPGNPNVTANGMGTVRAGSTNPVPISTGPSHGTGRPGSVTPVNPTSSNTVLAGGTPSRPTPTNDTPGSSTSTASTPSESPAQGTGNRNPIGKAVDWMKQDGFVQGAIKAGTKGGVIGIGAYTARTGASKIGNAISTRFGNKGISSDPNGDRAVITDGVSQNDHIPTDINNQRSQETPDDYNNENPEAFQESRPLNASEEQTPIPTSINGEEYHEADPIDNSENPNETGLTPVNDEEYNDVGSHNAVSDTIPASYNDGEEQDSVFRDTNIGSSISETESNNNAWRDVTFADSINRAIPVPASTNNETWNESANPGNLPASAVTTATVNAIQESIPAPVPPTIQESTLAPVPPTTQESTLAPVPPTTKESIPAPVPPTIQESIPALVPPTIQESIPAPVPPTIQESTPEPVAKSEIQMNQGELVSAQTSAAVVQHENVGSILNDEGVTLQEAPVSPVSSAISSESVSMVNESSVLHESATHESGAEYSNEHNNTDIEQVSGEPYESRQMPMNSQAIPADFPQNNAPQSVPVIDSSAETPIASNLDTQANTSPIPQAAALPDTTGTIINNNGPQSEMVQTIQSTAELSRMDTQLQIQAAAAMTTSEPASTQNPNVRVQTQTTNNNTFATAGVTNPGQIASQPTSQVDKQGYGTNPQNTGNNRPTAKGTSKNPSVRARRKKR